MIKIVIKGNPLSVNHTYGHGRGKTFYINAKARAYKDGVSWQAKEQYKGKPLAEDLEVRFDYFFPDKRKRDHLNANKGMIDSLNGIVWEDDRQIKVSHHYTRYDKKEPRIELEINNCLTLE
jgi:Holliday junction resolvase RusA-like endonuclease